MLSDVSSGRQIGAAAAAFVVGVPLGLYCYHRLAPLAARSRPGRFVAQFISWWLAIGAGLAVAAAVGTPYVFTGPVRGGGYLSDPITVPGGILVTTIIALAFSLFGIGSPHPAGAVQSPGPDV